MPHEHRFVDMFQRFLHFLSCVILCVLQEMSDVDFPMLPSRSVSVFLHLFLRESVVVFAFSRATSLDFLISHELSDCSCGSREFSVSRSGVFASWWEHIVLPPAVDFGLCSFVSESFWERHALNEMAEGALREELPQAWRERERKQGSTCSRNSRS